MKIRIKIPKRQLLKINPERLYSKVEEKLKKFSYYLISEIPYRTRAKLDVNLQEFSPLSEQTISKKGNDVPLFDTWEMMNSIEFELKDKQHLEFRNPTEYHQFHILGTKNMPKRDYFGVSEVDEIKLEDLIYEGMMELFDDWDRELQGTQREVITNY